MKLELKKFSHQFLGIFCFLFSSAVFACGKPTVIDIAFVYDSKTKPGIQARINSFIHDTNVYLKNSRVCMAVRSVGSMQARHESYVEERLIKLNDMLDLTYLKSSDYISSFRDNVGADLVHGLFDGPGASYCGRAQSSIDNFNSLTGNEEVVYAVTQPACGSKTFAHEIGHNMGLGHDIIQFPSRSTYFVPYAIGHGIPNKFGTIMSYANSSFNAPRISHFSNPSVPFEGLPTGVENEADAARALQQSKYIISTYRDMRKPFLRADSTIDYRIRSMTTDKCVDVAGFSKADGGNVHQWGCSGNPNQIWRVDFDNVNSNYVFRSQHSGLCLAASGDNLVQKNCNDYVDDSARWKLSFRNGGGYDVESVARPGRFLVVAGGNNNGANMVLAQGVPVSTGTLAGHKFHFEAYSFANRSTKPNDWGDGNAFSLVPHEIGCGSYGINQFRLKRLDPINIQYQYQCTRTPSHQAIKRYTRLNDSGPFNSGFASVRYLDRHNIECHNKAIKTIKLERSGNKWYYRYACGSTPVQNEKNYSTSWNKLSWRGDHIFLGQHDVRCGNNEVLTRVQLQTKVVGFWLWQKRLQMRYVYQCGSYPANSISNLSDINFSTSDALLQWSNNGPIPGLNCVHINEPADSQTWKDNYLCSTEDIGMRWSHSGLIHNMQCTRVYEGSANGWNNNYLCLPNTSDVTFNWHIRLATAVASGQQCVHFKEPSKSAAWQDNYLCYNQKPLYITLFDQYGSNPRTLFNEIDKILVDNNEKQKLVESLFNQENSLYDPLKLFSFFNVLFSAEQYFGANSATRNRVIGFVHKQASDPKSISILYNLGQSRTTHETAKTTLDFFKASEVPVLERNADFLIDNLKPVHIRNFESLVLDQNLQEQPWILASILTPKLNDPDTRSIYIDSLYDKDNPYYDEAITIKFLNYLFDQDIYQPFGIDPDSTLLAFALEHQELALSLAEEAINSGNASADVSELLSNLIQHSSSSQVIDEAQRLKEILLTGSPEENDPPNAGCLRVPVFSMGIYPVFIGGNCQ